MFSEIITSASQGAEFLKRKILAVGPYCESDIDWKISTRNQLFVSAQVKGSNASNSFYLQAGIDPDFPDDFGVSKLNVGTDWRGKGLGLAAEKAFLGAAHEVGVSTIIIKKVIDDGPSFWLTQGALPLYEPADLADIIADALTQSENLSEADREQLLAIGEISRHNPYLGLRRLAQTTIKVADAYWKSLPLKKAVDFMDLVLIPSETETHDILTQNLGMLPPFATPANRPLSERIISKLHPNACG